MRRIRIHILFAVVVCMMVLQPMSVSANALSDVCTVDLEVSSINYDRTNIMKDGLRGIIRFTQGSQGHVDMEVSFKDDSEDAYLKAEGIPVVWEMTQLAGYKPILTFDLSDYVQGLFVSVRILKNGSASIYVAADVDGTQYSAIGQALDFPLFTPSIVHKHSIKTPRIADVLASERVPSAVPRIVAEVDNVENAPSASANAQVIPQYYLGPRIYSVVHEVFFDDSNDVPEQVGGWCVDYSWVQYKVYREDVSEAQIKSDLRYYNMKHYYRDDWSRIMAAYEIDTHGYTSKDEPDRALLSFDGGWIYPSEVSSLWGPYSDTYYIRPDAAIVLASACQSLWNDDESSGAEMGDAFTNYGALGFIGSTINLPIAMDDWTYEFWWSLTYQDQTLGQAVSDANAKMNWASGEMQVYPSSAETRTMP